MRAGKLAAAAAALAVTLVPISAQAAPVTMPDGTVFDAEYYASANPDVAAAFGSDAMLLYAHYVTFGKTEGRLPVAAASTGTTATGSGFDASYYASRYPDVVAALGSDPAMLRLHYDRAGKAEGRYANAAEENAAAAAAAASSRIDQSGLSPAEISERVAAQVNEARVAAGKLPVEYSASLANAAFVRAEEVLIENSHTRPYTGQDWTTVFAQTGVSASNAEEYIIIGLGTPEEAVRYWLRDESRRDVILGSEVSKISAGYAFNEAEGKLSWILIVVK